MDFTGSKDLDCYEEGRQKMGFCRSKNLDGYEKGRKKMGFGRSKDLKLYDKTKKKEEKSWVSHEIKICIVMKKEEKR